MSSKSSKNHHCIPQFYLNRFGIKQKNGKYSIFIFNKNNGNFFRNAVSNISFMKKYNTVKVGSKETDEFEVLHNKLFEQRYSQKLDKVICDIEMFFKERKCINCFSNKKRIELEKITLFPVEHKYFLSILLAYFIKRSKKTRFFEEAAYDKMYDMMDHIYDCMKLDRNKFEENIYNEIGTKEQLKVRSIISCFNEEEIKQIAKCLFYHTWNIGYNRSEYLLYTCDSAHALTTTWKEKPERYGVGYATPGSMIMFPLTPKICILMYDTLMIEKENQFVADRNYVYLDEELVEFINQNIIFDAVDEIYSYDGNWKHLKSYYKKEKLPLGHKPYSVN